MTNRIIMIVLWLALQILAVPGFALEGDGQADLDKALQLKIDANSLAQLSEVAALCESAIEKGLDADNEQFARRLLTGSLYQRADDLCQAIFERPEGPDPRWQILRQIALPDLEKVVAYDDSFGEAFLLIAKLQTLPGGDAKKARQAIRRAGELFPRDKQKQSEVATVESKLQEQAEQRLAKLDQAIELDPENVEAWQQRAEFYRSQGNFEKAIEDFNRLLEKDNQNPRVLLVAAEVLANLDKFDDALTYIDKAIEMEPSLIAFTLRARIWIMQDKLEEAIADLDKALESAPDAEPVLQIPVLIMRARLYYAEGRLELALADIERVLQARPGLTEAIVLRSLIYAAQDKLSAAIEDIRSLMEQDPDNIGWKLQLATFVNANSQPRQAIALFDEILKQNPDNLLARRGRADALLSIGEHLKALADFEVVIDAEVEDSGVLNNLAWVLATSPDDSIRDGEKALQYATKACQMTDYQEAHILSTLAAAYAEQGDFQTAIKWSQKAVELSDEATGDQLLQELESYRQKKPWRERQQIEDKP